MTHTAGRSLLADHELVLLAGFAIASQQWTQLREIGERLCNEYPEEPKGLQFVARAAREVGDLDAAEQILTPAMERFPDFDEFAVEHAWLAVNREDWPAASERWKNVRTREPQNVSAYLWGAYALRQEQRYQAAEALIAQAMVLFADEVQPAVDYALIAEERGDWTESRRRWEALRHLFPDDAAAQARANGALRE
jgi:tetratricopeptide (TPR) repeat protein